MYKKILVAIGVIFLIFFIVKLCEKGPSEPSSFDSIYEESQEESQEETSTYDNSDSVVTRKREYSFRSITAIPMKLTMNTRAKIMMTTIQTGLMITTTMRVITTISEINKIQQEYFTSILLDKVKTA